MAVETGTRVDIMRFDSIAHGEITAIDVGGDPNKIEVTNDNGDVRTFTLREGAGGIPGIYVQEGYNRSPYLRSADADPMRRRGSTDDDYDSDDDEDSEDWDDDDEDDDDDDDSDDDDGGSNAAERGEGF